MPNMRLFSLNPNNQWTSWKSSDYFYPETIPEPDYSDSEDDCSCENRNSSYIPDTRLPIERLRDLTEIYISDIDIKKQPTQPKITLDKQGTLKPPTESSNEANIMSAKRSPQANRSKSPTKPAAAQRSRAAAKSPARSREKGKSPPRSRENAKSPAVSRGNAKSPAVSRENAKSPTRSAKTSADSKDSKSKQSTGARGGTEKSPTRSKTSKPTPKTKAASKAKVGVKTYPAMTKKGAGDASDTDFTGVSSEQSSDEDLIKPKKPYQTSSERLKLHKELKFSQKYCKLASAKTELQLALERYTENKVRRELDAEEKSSLEKILEHQAKKIEMQEAMDKDPDWMEKLQRQPGTWSNPRTDEFYRVHAKVVSNNILTECFLPEDDQSGCSSSNTFPSTDSGNES